MKYTADNFYRLNAAPQRRFLVWVKKKINLIRFFVGSLQIILNPYQTDRILRSAASMATPEAFIHTRRQILSQPGGSEILAKMPLLPKIDLDELLKYPTDTFGYQYARHMRDNNLDPDFYDVEFSDEITYTYYRYGKVHDMLHILTGFDTSIKGELGILAYTFAQSRGPSTVLISSLGLLHGVLFKPNELFDYVESFVKGWNMGMRGQSYMIADMNRLLSLPLDEARARMDLQVS